MSKEFKKFLLKYFIIALIITLPAIIYKIFPQIQEQNYIHLFFSILLPILYGLPCSLLPKILMGTIYIDYSENIFVYLPVAVIFWSSLFYIIYFIIKKIIIHKTSILIKIIKNNWPKYINFYFKWVFYILAVLTILFCIFCYLTMKQPLNLYYTNPLHLTGEIINHPKFGTIKRDCINISFKAEYTKNEQEKLLQSLRINPVAEKNFSYYQTQYYYKLKYRSTGIEFSQLMETLNKNKMVENAKPCRIPRYSSDL